MVVQLDTAQRFAQALDRRNYLAAPDCLTADCVHAARSLTHRYEHRLRLDPNGCIARISHLEPPDERRSLERFFHEVGLLK